MIYIIYRLAVRLMHPGKSANAISERGQAAVEVHQDPVCGVYLSESESVVEKHGEELYYFCSSQCRDKFKEQSNHKSF